MSITVLELCSFIFFRITSSVLDTKTKYPKYYDIDNGLRGLGVELALLNGAHNAVFIR